MRGAIQSILELGLADYLKVRRLPVYLHKAVEALRACRTAVLGGHAYFCPAGHLEGAWYNSCRHRACPQCAFIKIEEWLAAKRQKLLAGDHFQVVMTLASELRLLWRYNRKAIADLLFATAHEELFKLLAQPRRLGPARPGMIAALHTWGRTLVCHVHLHLLVTGGGLTPDGQWRAVRNGFLVPGRELRSEFRKRFCARLEVLLAQGALALPPGVTQEQALRWVAKAGRKKWAVHIKPPYRHGEGLATYLARYAKGGPMKNSQILAFDEKSVTFRYKNHRDPGPDGKPRQAVMTLPIQEFLDRLLLHVPPPGLQTVRSYGLYANTQGEALERARAALPAPCGGPAEPRPKCEPLSFPPEQDRLRCKVCGLRLVRRQRLARGKPPPPGLIDLWRAA